MPNDRAAAAADEFNRFAESTTAPSRCDPTLAFTTPELPWALALWREKAQGRAMPQRNDLSARALKPVLRHVAIVAAVDTEGTRRYRFRLMGTAFTELLGDHTGQFIDEAVTSPFRERWAAMMTAALNAGAPLRFNGRVEYANMVYLTMELLLAPLSDEHAGSVLVVGYARTTTPHVFIPMTRNTVSA